MKNIYLIAFLMMLVTCKTKHKPEEKPSKEITTIEKSKKMEVENHVVSSENQPIEKTIREETPESTPIIEESKKYIVNTPTDTSMIFFNDTIQAVFIMPDSTEIAALLEKYDEESFITVADDESYYTYEAREFLREKNIKTTNTFKRYVQFVSTNGDTLYVDTNKYDTVWALVVFDGTNVMLTAPIDIAVQWHELDF